MKQLSLTQHQLDVLITLVDYESVKIGNTDLSIMRHPTVKAIVSAHDTVLRSISKVLKDYYEELIKDGNKDL